MRKAEAYGPSVTKLGLDRVLFVSNVRFGIKRDQKKRRIYEDRSMLLDARYSLRSARIGSILAARRAGIALAAKVTSASTTAAPSTEEGSTGTMP